MRLDPPSDLIPLGTMTAVGFVEMIHSGQGERMYFMRSKDGVVSRFDEETTRMMIGPEEEPVWYAERAGGDK